MVLRRARGDAVVAGLGQQNANKDGALFQVDIADGSSSRNNQALRGVLGAGAS